MRARINPILCAFNESLPYGIVMDILRAVQHLGLAPASVLMIAVPLPDHGLMAKTLADLIPGERPYRLHQDREFNAARQAHEKVRMIGHDDESEQLDSADVS
jgi:hypothetical protein